MVDKMIYGCFTFRKIYFNLEIIYTREYKLIIGSMNYFFLKI